MAKDDDRVGYGRPPRSGQFVKGISGNPKGRPCKLKDSQEGSLPAKLSALDRLTLRHAERTMRVRKNGTVQTMGTIEAILEAQAAQAMRGGSMAARDYVERYERTSIVADTIREIEFEHWKRIDLENRQRLAQAERAGLAPPKVYPHPMDIKFRHDNRTVSIVGPLNPEREVSYRWLVVIRALAHAASVYRSRRTYSGRRGEKRVCLFQIQSALANQSLPPSMRWDERACRNRDERLLLLPIYCLKRYLVHSCERLGLPSRLLIDQTAKVGEIDEAEAGIRFILGFPMVDRGRLIAHLRSESAKHIDQLPREIVEFMHYIVGELGPYHSKLIAKRMRNLVR